MRITSKNKNPKEPAAICRSVLPAVTGIILAVLAASCSPDAPSRPTPAPVITANTTPIGDGLKVIGYSVLGSAVILILGRSFR